MNSAILSITDLEDYAHRLYSELGPRSVAVAARRAREASDDGREDIARRWRAVESLLLAIRGLN